jgi:hypothetical protein
LSLRYTRGIVDRYRLLNQRLKDLEGKPGREIFDSVFPPNEDWAEPFQVLADNFVAEWNIAEILDALRTNITQPELPSEVGYVRIMSLHRSKGLTADNVIITGVVEGLVPTRLQDLKPEEQERHIEEQRRLFYVALTRAKKTLVLSSFLSLPRKLAYEMGAAVRGGNKDTACSISSTFLGELGGECPSPVVGETWNY